MSEELIIKSIVAEPADMYVKPSGKLDFNTINVTINAIKRTTIDFITVTLSIPEE